jgi:LDH2 family malate/lactate/ureidoglycolate dehydrogenase
MNEARRPTGWNLSSNGAPHDPSSISVVDPRANGRFGVALGAVAEILSAGVRGGIANTLGRTSQHRVP